MKYLFPILGAAVGIAALILLAAWICYRMVFYMPDRKEESDHGFTMPPGEIYTPYRQTMLDWANQTATYPCEIFRITAFDGLTLQGKYYECAPGAPIELMFHGYKGRAERDLCGGIQRCFALGRNALLVDQRASSHSGGNTISFGINERRDCRSWVDFLISHFGCHVKIILTGISMGAATVMLASGDPMPPNVIGALADCGYTSAKAIIQKCAKQIHVPPKLVYPFIKLGARIFGKFDLEETSPLEAMQRCRIPVIFFHGDGDDFVPCEMSVENYEACIAPKKLVIVPGAGHGLCYLVDPEGYLQALREFSYEEAHS